MSLGINANTPRPRRKKAPRIEVTPVNSKFLNFTEPVCAFNECILFRYFLRRLLDFVANIIDGLLWRIIIGFDAPKLLKKLPKRLNRYKADRTVKTSGNSHLNAIFLGEI